MACASWQHRRSVPTLRPPCSCFVGGIFQVLAKLLRHLSMLIPKVGTCRQHVFGWATPNTLGAITRRPSPTFVQCCVQGLPTSVLLKQRFPWPTATLSSKTRKLPDKRWSPWCWSTQTQKQQKLHASV